MTGERLGELLAPFLGNARLSPAQRKQVSIYLDLLLKWNARTNLTAIRDPEEMVTRHFGESFFAASYLLGATSEESAIDLGSGAGFPGLPFKIWAPFLQLRLVESNQKKATFLKEVVRALELNEVTVLNERAELLNVSAELVSLRAVEHFENILPAARRLVAANGRLALLIGRTQIQLAISILPNVKWQEPLPMPLAASRVLLVGSVA